jgi:ribose transport system ATP-binding protein
VEQLAQGERQLVEIAKALEANAKLIIFDEPTTSLSRRETQRLFATVEKLRASGIAMVYISHALEDVRALCDDIAVLRDGELVGAGPAEEFSTERLITLMVGRSIDQLYPPRASRPAPAPVLEVEGVSQPGVVEDVTFRLHGGEVLGLAGLMGSGRSELARIIFGLDPHTTGEVRIGGSALGSKGPRERIRAGMAMLTESRRDDGLYMDASVLENMVIVHAQPSRVPGMCSSLRLTCADIERQPVRQLSGGNQQKVALGKWLVKPPRVLILDEPTRGIDVGAKYEIYRIVNELASEGVAVLMISSEIEELIGMCDRILVMRKGEVAGVFAAPYDREQLLGAAV